MVFFYLFLFSGILIERRGKVLVDESMLTGESEHVVRSTMKEAFENEESSPFLISGT